MLEERMHLVNNIQGLHSLIQKKIFKVGKPNQVKKFIEENQK